MGDAWMSSGSEFQTVGASKASVGLILSFTYLLKEKKNMPLRFSNIIFFLEIYKHIYISSNLSDKFLKNVSWNFYANLKM